MTQPWVNAKESFILRSESFTHSRLLRLLGISVRAKLLMIVLFFELDGFVLEHISLV